MSLEEIEYDPTKIMYVHIFSSEFGLKKRDIPLRYLQEFRHC